MHWTRSILCDCCILGTSAKRRSRDVDNSYVNMHVCRVHIATQYGTFILKHPAHVLCSYCHTMERSFIQRCGNSYKMYVCKELLKVCVEHQQNPIEGALHVFRETLNETLKNFCDAEH